MHVSPVLHRTMLFLVFFYYPCVLANSSCGSNAACRLFFHLTAMNPSTQELAKVESDIKAHGIQRAAENITNEIQQFQTVQLKTFAEPWSHADHLGGSTLDDTQLTIIKAISFEIDFRRILWDDIVAVATGQPVENNSSLIRLDTGDVVTAFYRASNRHFEDLESKDLFHHDSFISFISQTPNIHRSAGAVAGVLSTAGFGRAAYTAGTNRRVFKMLYKMGACHELDQLRDATSPENRILRDVAVKDPDGSVTTFKTLCKTCHGSLMDPNVPAFAYYDVSANAITYNRVDPIPPSNKLMKVVYANGYIPKNDQWEALFTVNQQKILGWPTDKVTGFGARSFGQAFSQSEAFASCQPKRAFETVCFRAPQSPADLKMVADMKDEFKANRYNLKKSFISAAIYCSQEEM